MIEREFVKQKKREFQVQNFITMNLKNVGHSFTELQRTPLGEKVIIHTSRPGLIVGRKGQNISKLTKTLQTRFKLENPQVEISEVTTPDLDPNIVAERIAQSLERFGSNRFKGIMHKTMDDVLNAGALGIEIKMSGKLPSSRAKSWRVYSGHLKKCGDAVNMYVRKAVIVAKLKSGVIGIQVSILPPSIKMPDAIEFKSIESTEVVETVAEEPTANPNEVEKKEPTTELKKDPKEVVKKEPKKSEVETKESK